ncbi:phosphotransferase [Streptomyces sp. NPDC051561]|uniref:phosphotransferase n=1 Tax=Streptomyces sp. NPDC051561 TaxID=3365658 RepID=UPI0037AF306C
METPGLEHLILPHTGSIRGMTPTEGNMSDLTAVVECERGPVFVKVMANRAGGRLESLYRERDIAPHVGEVSPALLWTAEDAAWSVLGYEAVPGRTSSFLPGSPDVDRVVDLVRLIGDIPLPTIAQEWHETRWDRWTEPQESNYFRGDALLFTDIHPGNFLIGEESSWVVDWSWPTRGAAFIDPACLVLQLIAAGHTPAGAEFHAARCPAWLEADPAAVSAFISAETRKYRSLTEKRPERQWLRDMLTALGQWEAHRRL